MNKFIGIAVGSLFLVTGVAHAGEHHKINPVCKPAWEHMRATQPQIEAAIKANEATKVGELVIANHTYLQDFFAKHPECKPKHHPMMK